MKDSIIDCQFSSTVSEETGFHRDPELLYVLKGSMKLRTGDTESILGEDDFVLINSNEQYIYIPDGQILIGHIYIDRDELYSLFDTSRISFSCSSVRLEEGVCTQIRKNVRRVFQYWHGRDGSAALLRESYADKLVYLLVHQCGTRSESHELSSDSADRSEEIMRFINEHYAEKISLADLSARFYLTETYLSRYISKVFGRTFTELLNDIRMQHAESDLISTDRSIAQIAAESGFSSQSWFNQHFKKRYGMPPAEYRRLRSDRCGHTIPIQPETDSKLHEMVEKYLSDDLVLEDDAESSRIEVDFLCDRACKDHSRNILNVGEAAELLRFDVREQLLLLMSELHYQYVGISNLYSERMMVSLEKDSLRYNFREMDKVFDFMFNNGLYPFIYLGHKQKWDTGDISVKIEDDKNQTRPDSDIEAEFLTSLVKHWYERYGEEYMSHWYVEIERFYMEPDTYFDTFDSVRSVFKRTVPQIRVGGAGFVVDLLGEDFEAMLVQWSKRSVRPDMLTVYCFPYVGYPDGSIHHSADPDYMAHQIKNIRRILKRVDFPECELIISIWSSTLNNRSVLNDSAFKGAFIMKNCIDNDESVDAMGYYMALDLSAENYDTQSMLFGGNGILSKDGFFKPAYYAFYFLARRQKYFLGRSSNAMITSDGKSRIHVCCHNYKHYGYQFYDQSENNITAGQISHYYTDTDRLKLRFAIKGVKDGEYIIRTKFVNQKTGSIQTEWKKLDYYEEPGIKDIEFLRRGMHPGYYIERVKVTDGMLKFERTLEAQEIQSIMIQRI